MSGRRQDRSAVRSDSRRSGTVRCALYTRKSSEEGLEQDFNSLHAQREACEAYVTSQRHEGWKVLAQRYDDGGYSGGTMQRPALQALLDDVAAGRVDVIVVYKVDRLTRALSDFARIVDILDAQGVSFVSVTQQFNTTSSMGRLTLNVLLSFAQFEREVTGERIRDKIAASKRKGLWMGGHVPLGYDPRDRTLVINEAEAGTVRTLFRLYLALGSVRLVQAEADRLGIRSKLRQRHHGQTFGGTSFSRGALYAILANPIYIGEIAHKGARYPAPHPPIIDRDDWEAVQRCLKDNAVQRKAQPNAKSPSLLTGLLFDETGAPLTPSHANKKGRRYRYYVSRPLTHPQAAQVQSQTHDTSTWRLPGMEIERIVIEALAALLRDGRGLLDRMQVKDVDPVTITQMLDAAERLASDLLHVTGRTTLRDVVERIAVGSHTIVIHISRKALLEHLMPDEHLCLGPDELLSVPLEIPVQLKRRGSELKIVLADQEAPPRTDATLIANLARGFAWAEELCTGVSVSLDHIARREGVTANNIRRYCDLAFLPTAVMEAIIEGRQPADLTSETIKRAYPLPVRWHEQERKLGVGRAASGGPGSSSSSLAGEPRSNDITASTFAAANVCQLPSALARPRQNLTGISARRAKARKGAAQS